MEDNFKKNVEVFHACVARWEKNELDKLRSLYIKDLNITRTLLLWIYPPFLNEYSNLKIRKPENIENEPLTFPGFGKDNYSSRISDWEKELKEFYTRWNVEIRPESPLEFTNVHREVLPILFNKKNGLVDSGSKSVNWVLYSNFPTPARALSQGKARTASTAILNSIKDYEVTLTIDTRWDKNLIAKEISKYVSDYQRLYCAKRRKINPSLKDEEILSKLQKTLHPNTNKCPQKNYYEYFYYFSVEGKGYQEIAEIFKIKGDHGRINIRKAIHWVIDFLDPEPKRGKDWAKSLIDEK